MFTKNLISTSLAMFCLFNASVALAGPGSSGGGGDICEDRIKVIRDDIKDWIGNGGPANLSLPVGISVDQYSESMFKQIGAAKIKCVGTGDEGFPVEVNGTAKVCRFDLDANNSQITCDWSKFLALEETDQYVLVHHELAGLAGIEVPIGDDSNYAVSNQLSAFLTNVVEKKLAIKPYYPGSSVLDRSLAKTTATESTPALLFFAIFDHADVGLDGGLFTYARGGSDTWGERQVLTLKQALIDMAAMLDLALLNGTVPPNTTDYQKLFLQDINLFTNSPELATGLSASELEQIELTFVARYSAGKDTCLEFVMQDGKIAVIENNTSVPVPGMPVLATGKNFAEAFKNAMANLK